MYFVRYVAAAAACWRSMSKALGIYDTLIPLSISLMFLSLSSLTRICLAVYPRIFVMNAVLIGIRQIITPTPAREAGPENGQYGKF